MNINGDILFHLLSFAKDDKDYVTALKKDPARIWTWNLLIRGQMPSPLGHRILNKRNIKKWTRVFIDWIAEWSVRWDDNPKVQGSNPISVPFWVIFL